MHAPHGTQRACRPWWYAWFPISCLLCIEQLCYYFFLIMPSSLVYVQPMTATLSTSCSHLPPSPSHSPKFSSHDSSFYTISLIHDAQFHLLLYSIALLFNLSILIASTWILTESLPSYYIWRRGMWITWLTSETTMSHRICCTCE